MINIDGAVRDNMGHPPNRDNRYEHIGSFYACLCILNALYVEMNATTLVVETLREINFYKI